MIFNAFQREDDDAVFTVVRNVAGETLSVGYPCVWDISASGDGVRVSKAAAGTLSLFRGVVAETQIADSGYGKVQVHGRFTDASVIGSTDVTLAAGMVLKATAAQNYLELSVETPVGNEGFVYFADGTSLATATTPAATTKDILLRAL